jgi:hypothetical protein
VYRNEEGVEVMDVVGDMEQMRELADSNDFTLRQIGKAIGYGNWREVDF